MLQANLVTDLEMIQNDTEYHAFPVSKIVSCMLAFNCHKCSISGSTQYTAEQGEYI